jgi:hypothetical protein
MKQMKTTFKAVVGVAGNIGMQKFGSPLKAVAALAVLLGGCGQAADAGSSDEPVASQSSALRCYSNTSDAGCVWKSLAQLLPYGKTKDTITHALSPALCGSSNPAGAVVISVDTGGLYHTLQLNQPGNAASWGDYTGNTFSSPPACTVSESLYGRAGIVVAGKDATTGMVYANEGEMAALAWPQPNPSVITWFAPVSSTAYPKASSSFAGNPALATGGHNTTQVVLALMSGSNLPNTVYAYVHALPYTSYGWSNVITGPALPTGWNAQGAPSIVWAPISASSQTFQIVVHARNSAQQDRLYVTHFNSDGPYFSNASGGQALAWENPYTLGPISGAPSVEYSPNLGTTTVYFLSLSNMMQTSYPYSSSTLLQVKAGSQTPPAFSYGPLPGGSSPSASAGWGVDMGTHNVVGRSGATLWIAASTRDGDLVP